MRHGLIFSRIDFERGPSSPILFSPEEASDQRIPARRERHLKDIPEKGHPEDAVFF